MEYIRKHAVRLLRLREQHTPPRSVIIIVVSLQLTHFLSTLRVESQLIFKSFFITFIGPRNLENTRFR